MFSVVIPVFNHENYVRDAIASALQSRLVSEILVVDDGSSDQSAAVIAGLAKQYPLRIRDFTPDSPGNRGAHYRLNQLCEHASNNWIAILNSDDEFVSGRFEVLRALATSGVADLIIGSLLIIDDDGNIIGEKRGLLDPEYPFPTNLDPNDLNNKYDIIASLCNQNLAATTSNMAFTKDLFRNLGGFQDLRYSHDWAFALKAAIESRVYLTRSYFTKYRIHASNTIKENSGHVDGEIRRFFYRILEEHVSLEANKKVLQALQANRHLLPYVPSQFIQGDKSANAGIKFDWSRRSTYYNVEPRVSRDASVEVDPRKYMLRSFDTLNSRALENSASAIQFCDYDFVVISPSLAEPPFVGTGSGGNLNAVYNKRAACLFEDFGFADGTLRGRIIRFAPREENDELVLPLNEIRGFEEATISGSDILIGPQLEKPSATHIEFPKLTDFDGPLILVLPMFMAVGGVERNTIEVMRSLRDRYRFLVVTTEWQAKHQGSLHYQLDDLKIPVLDLAEICDRSQHVALMAAIKSHYQPDAVWICNGSPWLADNAEKLRRIFSHTPIVDQQVYDTDHGWIHRYNDPGIQSFDHYIAINTRILEKFIKKIRIPRHRVSLIYSAIDTNKLARPLATASEVSALKQEIGVEPGQKCFAFIGRLTEQKRPLHFLELARRSASSGHFNHFILVGDGELGERCDEFISAHGLKNVTRIRYYEDSWAMMSKIDGILITSSFEGLPIVLLEALAFGRPAFSTDVGDIELVLEKYGSGSVCDPDSSFEIMWDKFCSWLSKLDDFTESAVRNRDSVFEQFSARTISRSYAEIWDRLISEARSSRTRHSL